MNYYGYSNGAASTGQVIPIQTATGKAGKPINTGGAPALVVFAP
jgi:hypothetical protein